MLQVQPEKILVLQLQLTQPHIVGLHVSQILRAQQKTRATEPRSMYTYFPTNEPWTWEQTRIPEARGQATSDTNRENRNDRRIPLERQGYYPQPLTERHPCEQAAPPARQEPNRVYRPKPDIEWQAQPGRQRRIDKFASAPSKPNRQSETNPSRMMEQTSNLHLPRSCSSIHI